MKTILTIWHTAGKGKTSTIREFANLLIATFHPAKIIFSDPSPFNPTGDFRLIIEINNKVVAIESKGDPSSHLRKRLDEILIYKPDIIICASRTRGNTVSDVDSFAATNLYQQIWTSTYQTDTNHQQVNQLKAKHMLELLQNLNLL